MAKERKYIYNRQRLYFSAIGALTLYLGVGIVIAWPSPALPLLAHRNFTSFENSLVASLGTVAPGPLVTMFGIDLFGRKGTLLINWLAMMSCWIILSMTENLTAILIAIFLGGCGMTASFLGVGFYISEIADVDVRDPLNGMCTIFMTLGMLTEYCIGPFVTFRYLAILSGAVTCLFGCFYWFLPESPYYFIRKGKIEDARLTLTWLRLNAPKDRIEEEIAEIKYATDQEERSKLVICSSKAVLKEFSVAFYILYFMAVSGQGPMAAYLQTVFDSVQLRYDPGYIMLVLAVVSLISAFPVPVIVSKFGDKPIFILSGFGCSLGHLLLAIYFFLLDGAIDVSSLSFIPIIGALILMVFFSLGLGGLVWAVVSDLFPPSIKAVASGICGIYAASLVFTMDEIFGLSKDAYGFGPTFLGFSVIAFISTFGFFLIPSITTLSLQEIQDYFEGNSNRKRNEIKITGKIKF